VLRRTVSGLPLFATKISEGVDSRGWNALKVFSGSLLLLLILLMFKNVVDGRWEILFSTEMEFVLLI